MAKTTRSQKEVKVVHASADYFEALFRARFVKVMKQLQKDVPINRVALGLHNTKARTQVVPRSTIEAALAPLKQVIIDTYRRGGKLGAVHVKNVLNG